MPDNYEFRRNVTVLTAIFLLIFLRSPELLIHGRMYAEEGTVYFRYAWIANPLKALLAPHQGYYSLFPNVCTLIAARLIPLPWAALFLTWCALAVQLLAVWLVLTCEVFSSIAYRAAAAFIVTFTAPGTETWLNTIGSQFHLAICVGIILISNLENKKILRNCTVLVAGLTGVLSCFLVPFFLVRALSNRAARIPLSILTTCTAIQASVLFHIGIRHAEHYPGYMAEAFLVKDVVLLYFSRLPAFVIGRFAENHLSTSILLMAGLLCLLILVSLLIFLRAGGKKALTLYAMGLWVLLLSLYGAVDTGKLMIEGSGEVRYFFICNVFIGLAILLVHMQTKSRFAYVMLVALILSGTADSAFYWKRLQAGPRWKDQVAYRYAHPGSAINITPVGWYPLQLP